MNRKRTDYVRIRAFALALAMLAANALWGQAESERILIPGGNMVGVYVKTDGLMYVGASDLGSTPSPARGAGLKSGDVIQKINGKTIKSLEEFTGQLEKGKTANLTVDRNGDTLDLPVTPAADPRDGEYRIGAWVRENTAGVGTLTFIDPETGRFGALGHAISDPDTLRMVPISDGAIYESRFKDIIPGKAGEPGELTGDFLSPNNPPAGAIDKNGETGVYGTYIKAALPDSLYPTGLPAADKAEIQTGPARIIATVTEEGPKAYDIEIIKTDAREEIKNLYIQVTDKELLEKTGGIVQGMSGSPIIQDGKLVGAVTHVLVNDPTRGYGIFIENMLNAAG
ncbi:MAG: SpoIVB peptidase [Clostridia bacterium]|nr:SpoIVB peptidase [Clostridia bacterium]